VLHFPVFNKVEGVSVAEEVDIVLGPDFIITIHDAKLRPLNKLFEQCKNNPGKRMGLLNRNPAYTLYKILDVLVGYIFPILDKIDDNLEALDEKIFKASSQSTIYEISTVRRDILAVRRILKPQISVLSSLERRKGIVGENDELDLEPLYADITDHINKIWDTLEEFKEIIESLSNTYDSLNSHRLNAVIKTLTIISVVTLPLTVITGLWGMNVGLPFMDFPHAFLIIIGMMLFTILGMLSFFKWRKWL
jgi:magnesium transporter